ncbi:cytidylyltransferase domain-containing protein [Schumannella sp. 10F1B-5-1]|uniref:cytidylyltransferase domain-containing protein n=1 Tax=Schumannella sp. 10F1B-5-1 TaxID=2590780 RepID=UPI0015E86F59|nr:glycosyltransferase family protein [Schumannella sp. 10F1B-5-1]
MTTIGVIQARMGSSRLPGKILASLGDESVLASTVRRLRAASLVDEVIVATTDQADDQETVGAAVSLGARVVRGSLHDVLGRFGTALEEAPGDVIVRVTADCPLLDPSLVDEVIAAVVGGADYATNRLPPPWTRTTPVGLDVEAMSAEALRTALAEATEPHQREHVTPYFYENPDRFGIELIDLPRDLSHLRVTVDTAEDLEIVRRLAPHLTALSRWQELADLAEAQPSLFARHETARQKDYRVVDARRRPS